MLTLRKPPLPLFHPACILATWFGAGLLKPASGTWGSLAALPFAWAIGAIGGVWALAIATLLVFLLGCWAAAVYDAAQDGHDASAIVIDEVAGQWLVLLVAPFTPIGFIMAFGLFRLFDILKPWPISWIDKKVTGGLGVMLDDTAAAIAAAALLWLAVWLFPERFLF